MNIVFYYAIVLLTYGLIRRVFGRKLVAFLTALFVLSAYAMIRYNLTQVWDIGGYFFYVLTLYVGWRWYESKHPQWLYLGGTSVGFGMLVKETGAIAAVFVGFLFLLSKTSWKEKITAFFQFSLIPFIVLIFNQLRSIETGFSSKDWFLYNWESFGYAYKPIKWAGVNATSFHWLWPLFIIGLILLIQKRKKISKHIWVYLAAILLPSVSYFAWPIFISRTVFIASWLMMPVAAWCITYLYDTYKSHIFARYAIVLGVVVISVTPIILQEILRYAHLFDIIEACNRNIGCAWNMFWENRHTYSRIK